MDSSGEEKGAGRLNDLEGGKGGRAVSGKNKKGGGGEEGLRTNNNVGGEGRKEGTTPPTQV